MRTSAAVTERRDDIQGLRAVAVLAVLAFHATELFPGGYVGVDVFFVISGYVITLMLEREQHRTGRISLGRFYVRRFKRLTPALAVVVSATMVGSALLLSPLGAQQTAASTAVGAMLMVANLVIAWTTGGYFDEAADLNPLLHTWSLSVEEQFYLLFPVLLVSCWWVANRGGWRRLVPVWVVTGVGAVSLALTIVTSSGLLIPALPDVLIGFYGPATRVWEFAAGALIALAGHRLVPTSDAAATWAGGVGAIGVVASLWLITPETSFPGPWTLLPVLATGLLLVAGMRSNPISTLLARGPMVRIGDLSYSLYLWHWPLIVFASLLWPHTPLATVAAGLLAIVPSWLSYHYLEQPVRVLETPGRRFIALVALTLIPPLLLSQAIVFAAGRDYWNEAVTHYRVALTTPHLSSTAEAGCTNAPWTKQDGCTWNASNPGAPIYLVGDSNAAHFSDAVVEAGTSLGRPVVIMAQIGCTFVDVHLSSPKRSVSERCNSYVDGTTDYLVGARPGTVVIANSYLWWYEGSGITLGLSADDATPDPDARLSRLDAGLAQSVSSLQDAGHRVVLVQPVPHWGEQATAMSWAGCSVVDMTQRRCVQSFPLSEAERRQGAVWNVVQAVAERVEADLLDVSGEICPSGTCLSETPDGLVRYLDATHISVDQSRALSRAFRGALA